MYLYEIITNNVKGLTVYKEDGYLKHRRLGHIGMDFYKKRLSTQESVRGIPKMSFEKTYLFDAC